MYYGPDSSRPSMFAADSLALYFNMQYYSRHLEGSWHSLLVRRRPNDIEMITLQIPAINTIVGAFNTVLGLYVVQRLYI